MFLKSLQWRFVFIFFLLVLAVMIIVGVFLLDRVESVYFDDFHAKAEDGFNKLNRTTITLPEITKTLKSEAGDLFGIYGSAGECAILDIENFTPLNSDGKATGEPFPTSHNLALARNNNVGDDRNSAYDRSYYDYARYINTTDGKAYIFYLRYSRDKLESNINNVRNAVLISLVFSLAFSIVIAYFLSKTITVPVQKLTGKVKLVAEGNFDSILESSAMDEIGQLTRSFNHMASELKNTLNVISSEKNKVQTILHYMADGVLAFNLEGKMIHGNMAAQNLLKPAYSEDIDLSAFCGLVGLNIPVEEILSLKQQHLIQKTVPYADTYLAIYFAPFTDEENNTEGVIAVIQDITEQQKLDNMRREFVANVSHELRTPLTSIKSYSETLLNGAMEDAEITERFLKVINSEADRMTRLVKDLLQLTRLDANNEKWQKQEFVFDTTVKGASEKLVFECESKHQSLTTTLGCGEASVYADKDRIEQVILNLLSNAIKYTPDGGTLKIETQLGEGMVIFSITDTGIGVPEADLPRIFERFYRVDKARSRDLGGTGLGLAIAKEIVEAHDGSISMTSVINEGSCVTVKLPICNSNLNDV